jgi:hypothetical protein
MAAKVKLNISRLSIPELIERSQQITAAMTGNPEFTTPNPKLSDITDTTTDVQTANNNANQARMESKAKTSTLNELAEKLRGMLSQLASYVDNIANGKDAVIQSAGMDVKAAASAGAVPSVPTGFETTTGDNDGSFDLGWNAVEGASSYVVERSLAGPPAADWQHQATVTKSRMTVEGLTSGTRYWFRVAAVAAKGQGGWSDISTRIAP